MQRSSSSTIFLRQPETIPLGDILGSYELGLVLIAGTWSQETPLAAEADVQWVHGSDLADPSSFLTPRTVLLTTGAQFKEFHSSDSFNDYVKKLVDVGVAALGFGVEIVYERTPTALIDACDKFNLPLFRVPYDTPFIQISLTAARLLAAKSYARNTWSLETQRSIARAAVRGRGVYEALDTLTQKLGRWAALATTAGNISYASPPNAKQLASADWVKQAVKSLSQRGDHANTTTAHDGVHIHLQTIPGSLGSLGVLIVESSAQLDHAERGVIEFVTALASVYLEQQRYLMKGESQIQNVIFELLLSHETELAAEIMLSAGLGAVSKSVRVCFLGPKDTLTQSHLEHLRGFVAVNPGTIFAGYQSDSVLFIPSASLPQLVALSEAEKFSLGISRVSDLDYLQKALDEARTAYQIAASESTGENAVVYSQEKSGSLIELLYDSEEAHRRATLLLAPIRRHDEQYAEDLENTLRVWLQHHGQNSPTANVLEVHRHTVANRIKLIFDLIKRDSSDPAVRSECLSALTLTTD
ncbi:MAG TPA: PucR family transcriptional regulator [Microbacteriaceae bacterium]|nr:PucR family transcriptional regulator [Microbacteriaceae bacterium]